MRRKSNVQAFSHWLRWLAPALALCLVGCATYAPPRPVPAVISTPPEGDPKLYDVQAQPDAFAGRTVRWGGTIVAVEPGLGKGELQVLARPLDTRGQPDPLRPVLGEFLVRGVNEETIDDLEVGGEVTVVGVVSGLAEMGQAKDPIPMVDGQHLYIWRSYPVYAYDPGWDYYDPYWDYPYWYHHYPFHDPFYRHHYPRAYWHHYYRYRYPFRHRRHHSGIFFGSKFVF